MKKKVSDLSIEELAKKERDLRESLFKLRFQHGIRRLDNPAQLSNIKKQIAQVKTILSAKNKTC